MSEIIYFSKTKNYYKTPNKSHKNDAGYDVYVSKNYKISPKETKVIPSGISVAIPENHFLMVVPRSGLSLKTPLRIANTPGIIDSGYRDEVGIIIYNSSQKLSNASFSLWSIDKNDPEWLEYGNNRNGTYLIPKGSRIAQLLLIEYTPAEFVEIDDVENLGQNRGGGFGSTGIK